MVVQICECVLRKLDRRGGLERIAELQEEEATSGIAGESPEGEEARGRVVILVNINHNYLHQISSQSSISLIASSESHIINSGLSFEIVAI